MKSAREAESAMVWMCQPYSVSGSASHPKTNEVRSDYVSVRQIMRTSELFDKCGVTTGNRRVSDCIISLTEPDFRLPRRRFGSLSLSCLLLDRN